MCARHMRSPSAIPRCWRNCIATAAATRPLGTRACSIATVIRTAAGARSASARLTMRSRWQAGACRSSKSATHCARVTLTGAKLGRADLRVHRTLHLSWIVRWSDVVRTWDADSGRPGAARGRLFGASRGHALPDHAGGLAAGSGRGRQLAVLHGPALRHGTGALLHAGVAGPAASDRAHRAFHAAPWGSPGVLRAIPGRSARLDLFVG